MSERYQWRGCENPQGAATIELRTVQTATLEFLIQVDLDADAIAALLLEQYKRQLTQFVNDLRAGGNARELRMRLLVVEGMEPHP